MKNIKICVFDAYGTLFDFNSAANAFKSEIGANYDEFTKLWRSKQLEYSFLREIMGSYADFFEVTKDALTYTMEFFKMNNSDLQKNLMNSYLKLNTYTEVDEFLNSVKTKGIKRVILSNGSKNMLDSAINSSNIKDKINEAISVEDVKCFKPNKEVYKLILSKYNVKKEEVLFFSSNGWDIAGASNYGFNTIWINRSNLPIEKLDSKPSLVVNSLDESLKKF